MQIPWLKYKKVISKKKNEGIIDFLFKSVKIHWWLIGFIFVIITAWLVFPSDQRQELININDFKLGQKSSKDVYANLDVEYQEIIESDEEKQRILADIPPVFNLDFQGIKKIEEQFDIVNKVRSNNVLPNSMKIALLKEQFYMGPSDKTGLILLEATDAQLKEMKEETIKVLSYVLSRGIIADGEGANFANELSKIDYLKPKWDMIKSELESKSASIPIDQQIASQVNITLLDNRPGFANEKTVRLNELMKWSEARIISRNMANELPEPISNVVREMVDIIRPNLVYNPVITQKQQEQLLSNISSMKQKITKGDKLLSIGDLITESHIRKIKVLSSAQKKAILYSIPSVFLLVLVLAILFIIYAERQERLFAIEPRKVLAPSVAILLVLALANIIINQGPKLGLKSPGLLIPSALASIIIAIIANVQLSIVSTCIIGALIALSSGVKNPDSYIYFLLVLIGGIASAISASHARRRRHLIIPGLYVSITNLVVIFSIRLLTDTPTIKLGTDCLTGAVNGVLVALLTPGFLPLFEYLSRTTTDMELLELSDLNQPLLTQLKEKAIGSYYHSLDVAKLAEAGAEAIKANPLLARVGAYYHDIGKMTKPEFFIENQKGENVHDKLNPSMSSRIIASHVKDGVKIASDSKLPKIIQDIIQQHHGSTLIGGLRFYQKAMEADRHNTVKLEDYRYPGPKPQTKESAIILLADSVESARHVLLKDDPSYSRLINFVRKIIEDKTMDDQLDECDLTLRDINLIGNEFVRVLSGMYHTRIEYPKENEFVNIGAGND